MYRPSRIISAPAPPKPVYRLPTTPKPAYQPPPPAPVCQPPPPPPPVCQPSAPPTPVYQPPVAPTPVYQPPVAPTPVPQTPVYQPPVAPTPVYQVPSLTKPTAPVQSIQSQGSGKSEISEYLNDGANAAPVKVYQPSLNSSPTTAVPISSIADVLFTPSPSTPSVAYQPPKSTTNNQTANTPSNRASSSDVVYKVAAQPAI